MDYDLYSVYESVGWLYRLMGCFPYVLSGPKQSRCYVLNTIAVTFNILFFIMGAKYFYEYLNMVNRRFMSTMDDDSLSVLILALRQFFSIICILDAMILKIIYSKQIISSMKNLAIQDEILKSFGYHFNYKLASKWSFIVVTLISLISYSIINLEFVILITLPLPMILRIFGNMTVLVQFTNISLFCFLIINVGFRFKALNSCISNPRANCSDTLTVIMIEHAFKFIKTSASVHANLCKKAKMINKVFTVTIVASVVKVFFLSAVMTYLIYLGFKYGTEYVAFEYMLLFFSVLITNISMLLMIVLSCNWTSSQANATVNILHQVALEGICLKDESLSRMIRTFLVQISHHNLKFTAADLFSINSALLQSFTVVITTYLVILIEINPKVI